MKIKTISSIIAAAAGALVMSSCTPASIEQAQLVGKGSNISYGYYDRHADAAVSIDKDDGTVYVTYNVNVPNPIVQDSYFTCGCFVQKCGTAQVQKFLNTPGSTLTLNNLKYSSTAVHPAGSKLLTYAKMGVGLGRELMDGSAADVVKAHFFGGSRNLQGTLQHKKDGTFTFEAKWSANLSPNEQKNNPNAKVFQHGDFNVSGR